MGPLSRTITFTNSGPTDQERGRILTGLTDTFNGSTLCVIDLDFPTARLRQAYLDTMLAEVFASALDAVTPNHRVLIIVSRPIPTSDDLAYALSQYSAGSIAVITTQGDTDPVSSWLPQDSIRSAATVTEDDLRDDLRSRILRRRGVFQDPSRQGEYTLFRYTPDLCMTSLHALVRGYLERNESDLVLYDLRTSGWMREALLGPLAVVMPRTGSADYEDLFGAETPADTNIRRLRRDFRKLVAQKNQSVLLIEPLIKSGRSVCRKIERLHSEGCTDIRVLTVMVDERRLADDGTAEPLEVDDEHVPFDYLAPVSQQVVTEAEWHIKAALAAGLIEDPEADWERPSLIGLWQLFETVKCGVEQPKPKRRLPIRWFPKISEMGPYDALWIAESLVRVATKNLISRREKMLFVLPNEASGSRPIANALRKHLEVAVQLVDRDVFEGAVAPQADLVRSLQQTTKQIIVVDESTITYGTLRDLEQLVFRVANRSPDLLLAAIELPLGDTDQRPTRLHSLHQWSPFLLGEA